MSTRKATHAGSWYTEEGPQLDSQLSGFLEDVKSNDDFNPPIVGCKAIVAPHAGYSYSGPAAAWAYKSIDVTPIKRVFILGPSHHVYLDGCALSKCKEYETPIGNLPIDLETVDELRKTGMFEDMSISTDEDEHSIEMHLPYVRKVFEGKDIQIVPILIGGIDQDKEVKFGALLAPFLARSDTLTVISSDFCHWGTRFHYTRHQSGKPIHESISELDQEAMELSTMPPATGHTAHVDFTDYLQRTKNTICGRHPIGVCLGAISKLEQSGSVAKLQWVRYEQSSKCNTRSDSSVSYASAYITF